MLAATGIQQLQKCHKYLRTKCAIIVEIMHVGVYHIFFVAHFIHVIILISFLCPAMVYFSVHCLLVVCVSADIDNMLKISILFSLITMAQNNFYSDMLVLWPDPFNM